MDYLDNLHLDESVIRTQDRLAKEDGSLADLLGNLRHMISPVLIGDRQWQQILTRAGRLPMSLSALPFGFELPLHDSTPKADFGVSIAAGTRAATLFKQRAKAANADAGDVAVARLIEQMDVEDSPLRSAVGPKLMLEYDVGSGEDETPAPPGIFLRPYARPVIAGGDHLRDLGITVGALLAAVDWAANAAEQGHVERVFLTQPVGTHTDSFGAFPSRGRAIRLLITGLEPQDQLCAFLRDIGWPGQLSAVESVMSGFEDFLQDIKFGVHLDVSEKGIGASLGLTPQIKARFAHNRRYFFDDLSEWAPLLDTLRRVDFLAEEKLRALEGMVSRPAPLFAKSGRYVLLRGIHHIKLAIAENRLAKAKAYIFMVILGDTAD